MITAAATSAILFRCVRHRAEGESLSLVIRGLRFASILTFRHSTPTIKVSCDAFWGRTIAQYTSDHYEQTSEQYGCSHSGTWPMQFYRLDSKDH